jgi:hypothetical protein
LFAFSKKTGAARASAADVARRRDAAAIEEGFGRSGDVQKSLLAEKRGPDGLVALEAISIEGVVPTRLGVNVLAFLRVAAVIGLLEGPAVWNGVENVRDRRKRVRGSIFDVCGIGIEAMTNLVIGSERRLRFGRKCRTKLGEARKARARLHGRDGDERDFKGQDFVRLQGKIRKNERRVIFGFDAELVLARRQRKNPEDAFSRSGGAEDFAGLDVAQCENCSGNRKSDVGEAGVTDETIEHGGGLRLLAGDAQRRAGFARLFQGVLRRERRLTWESCGGARRKNGTGKAANRAERASNLPRIAKDHAFGLNGFDERNRVRVLDNNIDEQRATVFPEEWSHSITRRKLRYVHQFDARGRQRR